ncbi:PhzF family phenazine biosynthesis protein [Paracoccus saliphilus]|uniref:Phenazine biosynthesis protein PhzF family n=1 Tax=Paracoccus saliphilus TaxID=405559 RepID=A0AA46A7F8_9RHOB|nr:PhzF family phenazine biosynthesis protein [Paracoccus saliphilus]WCR04817.1 PhzF family phenazine biosynthesis protein [Paracoccus saliphilus]SIT12943.1 phenazine biosynthesis protein PhzF family [Paracoccus saliphilus]
MRIYQVDAFTDRLFTGNPAAVLVLEDWLPDDLMQAIAQENNLAASAFVNPRADGTWDLRWFSPTQELDFCGHASLATAHILFTNFGASAAIVFHTQAGQLRASKDASRYQLDIPSMPPEVIDALPPELKGMFSSAPAKVFRNFKNIFADLGSADAVCSFVPDFAAITQIDPLGLVVTGQEVESAKADFVSRCFAPSAGIPEDPVTGSTHATLVPYWAGQLGRDKLVGHQASKRGGWLTCELTNDRVLLGGNAVTYMEAEISL